MEDADADRSDGYRIAHVIDSLAAGGAERVTVDLANEQAARGYAVAVVATRGGGPLVSSLAPGIDLTVVDRRHRWDATGLARVALALRRFDPTVVQSHGASSTTLVALLKVTGVVRAVHVYHDHISGSLAYTTAVALAHALSCDAYVAAGRDRFDHVTARVSLPPPCQRHLLNGIDTARFVRPNPLPSTDGSRVRAVFVSNLRDPKDHETVVRAMASGGLGSLRMDFVGASFGDRYEAALRRLISEGGLEERVALCGPTHDVAELLAGYDVGVFSSTSETGPLVVAEYLAAGLPVVTTTTGAVVDEAVSWPGVWGVPPTDVSAMRLALEHVCALPAEERRSLGRQNQGRARGALDRARVVDDLEGLYRDASRERLGCVGRARLVWGVLTPSRERSNGPP